MTAGGVGHERLRTGGGVEGARCVAKKRAITGRRVVVAGGVVNERLKTGGRVCVVGVVLKRISSVGRILVAGGVVTQRQSTGGRVYAASRVLDADDPSAVLKMPVAL